MQQEGQSDWLYYGSVYVRPFQAVRFQLFLDILSQSLIITMETRNSKLVRAGNQ